MKSFILAFTVFSTIPALAAEPPAAPASIVARVQAENASLGWDGLFVDMGLEAVEELVGAKLSLKEGSEADRPYDRYATDIVRNGQKVHLAFDGDGFDARLNFIGVRFPSAADAAALTADLVKRIPDLEPSDDGRAHVLAGSDCKIAVRAQSLALGKLWIFD